MIQRTFLEFAEGRLAVSRGGSRGSKPLLMVHGNSLDQTLLEPLFATELSRYDLASFDLPGHGGSFRSPQPQIDYAFDTLAAWIPRVARALWADTPPVVLALSLGGHLTVRSLASWRPAGLLLAGYAPIQEMSDLARSFLPTPAAERFFRDEVSSAEWEESLTTISNGSPELRRKILASIQRTDVRFRGALGASMATLTSPQEFTRLDTSGLPSAAFAGGDEHYLSGDYLDALTWKGLWRGRVQRLPGAGHLVLAEQPEELGRLAVEAMEAWGA